MTTTPACKHCPHGWHGLGCDELVLTGDNLSRCVCPNSAPQVPSPAQYAAGIRNPGAGVQVANLR